MTIGPTNIYSDIDLDFIKHPLSGDVTTKKDLEAVKRSLRNLILYNRYEKPFQPTIFTGIKSLLFEHNTPIYSAIAKNKITEIIRRYEPRINELRVEVVQKDDSNDLEIKITFSVRSFPDIQQATFVLERLR